MNTIIVACQYHDVLISVSSVVFESLEMRTIMIFEPRWYLCVDRVYATICVFVFSCQSDFIHEK